MCVQRILIHQPHHILIYLLQKPNAVKVEAKIKTFMLKAVQNNVGF